MEFVTYEQDGFVGVVTINRPKALNALNSEVLKEIEATFDAIDLDATRAVVLTVLEINLSLPVLTSER